MNSFRQFYYHIVIATKKRRPVITEQYHDELFRYINGFVRGKQSVLYEINGIEDHVHLFCSIHPTVPVSDFINKLKTSTNKWMKSSGHFPDFDCWSVGYGAFTKSERDKGMIINYIRKQKEHHRKRSFTEEFKAMLDAEGIAWDERYL